MVRTIFRRPGSTTMATTLVLAAVLFAAGCAVTVPRHAVSDEEAEAKKQALNLFVEGKTAEAKGNRDAAIPLYFEARQYDPGSVEIAIALSKAFTSSGKVLSALQFARVANEIDPTNVEALNLLQYLFQQTGNVEMAAEALEAAIKLTPNPDLGMVYRLAQYYLLLDKRDKARTLLLDKARTPGLPRGEVTDIAGFFEDSEMYDDAASIYALLIKRDPMDVDAWASLGNIEEREGKEVKARETFRKALAANPGDLSLYIALGNNCMTRNDWACAIDYFEKARAGGFTKTKIMSTLTALYYYADRPTEAEALRDSVIAAGDDDAQFYFFLGKAMNYRKEYEKGAAFFQTGFAKPLDLLSDTQKLNAYVGLIQCLVRIDRTDEALRVIQEDAVQNIKDPQYVKDIEASVYMEMKRYDDAAAIYSWLTDADPENPRYLFALTQAYNSAGKYAESESVLINALEQNPDDTRLLMHLGIVYDLMQDKDKAEDVLLTVIRKEPKNALALNNLAYMYIDAGKNLNKAISMVKRALAVDPDNGAYLDTMGWGLFRKGDVKKARVQIEKALENAEPQDKGVIYDHYGDILSRLGLKSEARAAYAQAIESGEDAGRIAPKIEELGR